MFNDPLIELMQDVGGDNSEDIDVRKILPEWLNNRPHSLRIAGSGECSWALITSRKDILIDVVDVP